MLVVSQFISFFLLPLGFGLVPANAPVIASTAQIDFSVSDLQEQEKKGKAKQEKEKDKGKKDKGKKKAEKKRAVALAAAVGMRPNYSKARFLAAKKFLVAQDLAAHIDLLERICQIDKKQKLKLSIAAKRHSAKFADQWMKDYGNRFQGLFNNRNGNKDDEDKEVVFKDANEIDASTLSLVQNSRRIYLGDPGPEEHKDWRKDLVKVLNEKQLAAFDKFSEEKKARFRKTQIQFAMNLLDMHLDLSEEQADKIKTLIKPQIEKFTRPPVRFVYLSYITIYCLLKTDSDELNAILTPAQHQKWKILVNPYQAVVQRMDQELEAEENEK